MKLQGQQHCHLVAKAVEKPQTNRETRASQSYARKKRQSKSSRGCPLTPAAPGDLAISCFSLTSALKNSAFHVSTGTASHSIKLRGAQAATKLITYALASVAMCCFSSRCSPRASGGKGRSKTVALPEFSILLIFPQQNLLLGAQQFPLVRTKGKNMRWLTKCGHKFKAEDITFLYKKRPNPCFHISPCLSPILPSATRDSPQPPWVPWDVATRLQFSPAEARNVPFPSANHFTWTHSFQVLQIWKSRPALLVNSLSKET